MLGINAQSNNSTTHKEFHDALYKYEYSHITFSNIQRRLKLKMNNPRRYSSSSSSVDSDVGYVEKHYNRRCKYEWHHRNINGEDVFIFIRICKCEKYDDMRYLRRERMDLNKFDGKDIHFYRGCKWERTKGWECGRKVYILSANCDSCTSQYGNHIIHAINSVKSTFY